MYLYDVILNNPRFNKVLTYSSSSLFADGDFVAVPLKKRTMKAYILKKWSRSESQKKPTYKIQNIKEKIYPNLKLPGRDKVLLEWMARYYHYPLGKLIFDVLPKDLKRPRPFSPLTAKEIVQEELNSDQSSIYKKLCLNMEGNFSKALIHGVTGSGKTRIYKNLMKVILKKGKSILFLLPEINLTPQFIDDFKKSFNCFLYLYNSGISESKRYGAWETLQQTSHPGIIVGVRSSLFLPIANLGLIIVDEEHDSSFKQEDRCCYNARDMATKKASLYDIPIILGSATPSLETYHAATKKKAASYFPLKARVHKTPLPEIVLVDEKRRIPEEKNYFPFKKESLLGLKKALEAKEKAVVFINRLGYFSILQCRFCGHAFECPNCSIGLKFYKSDFSLRCNHCFHREKARELCPQCSCMDIWTQGFGTEKVEEVLKCEFPNHVIARFDRDQIKNTKELNDVINRFRQGHIDILIGTQMISKGHNFEGVNTIVVLGTDSLLHFPDFRANERAYQTLTQVSGRCGRFGKRGRVYIQTMDPEHELYLLIKESSFDKFYKPEIELRKACGAPPFRRICLVSLNSSKKDRLEKACEDIHEILTSLRSKVFKQTRILGPRPALMEKRMGRYTWVFMIDSPDINELHNCLRSLVSSYTPDPSLLLKLDVDPSVIS